MSNEEKNPIIPRLSNIQDLTATHPSQRLNLEDDTPTEQLQPRGFKDALVNLLPHDHYDVLIAVGTIIGILHYWVTKDTWLLMTFIGFWTGRATKRTRQDNENRRGAVT